MLIPRGQSSTLLLFYLLNNFIHLFGCAGSSSLHGLFSSRSQRGGCFLVVCRLLIAMRSFSRLLLLQSPGPRAQQLWHMGLVPPQHVRSSRTRNRTPVPCTGRRILHH